MTLYLDTLDGNDILTRILVGGNSSGIVLINWSIYTA